jgi:hypothetical protein
LRREKLEKDTEEWLKFYLFDTFPLPFAMIHRDYIRDLDYIVEFGGWKAEVLPRSSGKTMIAQGASLKYILTGLSSYAVMIAATANFSANLIKTYKSWLLHNERLAADYPEVCKPIQHTRGIPQGMSTLTAFGEPVYMQWTADKIVLPNSPRITPKNEKIISVSANAIIDSDGITGAIRGRNFALPNGKTVRPDLCIVDDPQTPESAKSVQQTTDRLSVIKADIAGLAGPGKDIRIIVPCTILEEGDLADQISDPIQNPDFMGERHAFFKSMPVDMEAWEKYNEIRIKGLNNRDRGEGAKKYYLKHKKKLNKGCVVTWPERCGDNAIDGVQWGMNQYFKLGPKAFQTELQGAPLPSEDMIKINKNHVLKCETDLPRLIIPHDHYVTTAFIDCNPRTSGLHWTVCSFGKSFNSHVPAYGLYPERGTLVPEGASDSQEKALLFEGLRKVCDMISKLQLVNTEKTLSKVDLVMIDGGYMFETVIQFVQSARFPFQLTVDRGRASTKYDTNGRDVIKVMPNIHLRKNKQREKYLSHNVDVIREIVHRAFLAGKDAPGGIGLHQSPPLHENFADHITAMKLTDKATGEKGDMYRWNKRPGTEEHWLDCVVGCYGGASWLGVESGDENVMRIKKPKHKKLSVRKVKI